MYRCLKTNFLKKFSPVLTAMSWCLLWECEGENLTGVMDDFNIHFQVHTLLSCLCFIYSDALRSVSALYHCSYPLYRPALLPFCLSVAFQLIGNQNQLLKLLLPHLDPLSFRISIKISRARPAALASPPFPHSVALQWPTRFTSS